MTQLIALLISAIQLYTAAVNPSLPQSVRDASRALADQTFAVVQTELSKQSVGTPLVETPPVTPIVQEEGPIGVGAPFDSPIVLEPTPEVKVEPSCSLTGIYRDRNVDLSWTLNGIDPWTEGILYFQKGHNGGKVDWGYKNPLSPRVSLQSMYKASFGNVSCYAFFPNAYSADNPVKEGDVSTSVNPFNMTM